MSNFLHWLNGTEPEPEPRPLHAVGATNGTAGQGYAAAALAAEVRAVEDAAQGTRNATLFAASRNLAELVHMGAFNEADIEAHLTSAALTAGLDEGEIPGTIASGIGKGILTPREPKTRVPGQRAAAPVIATPSAESVNIDEAPKRLRDGAAFILDAPDTVPTLWGDADDIIWARGEALMIVGPPGVGKTTLTGQLLRALLGLGDGTVLGYPVVKTEGVVLYLAMDRPAQIARALRRAFSESEREHLSAHLKVWEGPPPADIAKRPEILSGLADMAGADIVVIDSLKDAAIGLGEDEVAAGYNRARQMCLAAGIEVLELHHLVKRGPNGAKPNTLADVYGSAWLTAGAGSVILLWGQAGDPIVELGHLKQPAGEVGPFRVIHDHIAGTSVVHHGTDLVDVARQQPQGLTAQAAAVAMFDAEKPTPNQVEKARRRLDKLTLAGLLEKVEGHRGGGDDRVLTRWKAITEAITAWVGETGNHGPSEQSRNLHNRRSGNHGSNHGNHATGAITIAPPSIQGGESAPDSGQDEELRWDQR